MSGCRHTAQGTESEDDFVCKLQIALRKERVISFTGMRVALLFEANRRGRSRARKRSGYFDGESLDGRYDVEVMIVAGKVETV